MSVINLEQEFKNNFNCYTEIEQHDGGDNEEMAMTKAKFVEVVSNLLKANGVELSASNCNLDVVTICTRSDCDKPTYDDSIYCLDHAYEHKMQGY